MPQIHDTAFPSAARAAAVAVVAPFKMLEKTGSNSNRTEGYRTKGIGSRQHQQQ